MNYQILVDDEFPKDLHAKVEEAQRRIYMQFMTFDGDQAGLALAQRLIKAKERGVDVRVVIDYYTDFYVSDTYYKRPEVRDEVKMTKQMINDLVRAGVLVYRTRPYGPFKIFFGARNHKKLIIIDDYAYLGGINISDHNYSWHDTMIRFKEPAITRTLLYDFRQTLLGQRINLEQAGVITNDYLNKYYRKIIGEANSELVISSPYFISWNLLRTLKRKHLKVSLFTLQDNNYSIMNFVNRLIFPVLIKNGVKIYFYKKFSHAKFLIADRKKILLGSSNFCINRFPYSQNIGFYSEDPKFIGDFYNRMVEEQKDRMIPYDQQVSGPKYFFSLLGLFLIGIVTYPILALYALMTKLYVKELGEFNCLKYLSPVLND
ncbi:MAG: phosphatidylserine/phosphatidylglycerophosphate/cardiolipin synthase family protein [candidate division WOR-3 bacterium]